MDTDETREQKALRLVFDCQGSDNFDGLKLVWFCKALKNWKAIIVDLSEGGNLYEVTYNGDKEEAYIDEYLKVSNTCIPD